MIIEQIDLALSRLKQGFDSPRERQMHDLPRHCTMPLQFWSATPLDNRLIAQAARQGLPLCAMLVCQFAQDRMRFASAANDGLERVFTFFN
jgi:hypothetical protein